MRQIILLVMALVIMLVSINGCYMLCNGCDKGEREEVERSDDWGEGRE